MAKRPTQRQPKFDSGSRNSNHSSYTVKQERASKRGFSAAVWLREISQWANEAIEMPAGIPSDGIPRKWLPPRPVAC